MSIRLIALHKLGAVKEGVLRKSFFPNEQYDDQILWSVTEDDWHESKAF